MVDCALGYLTDLRRREIFLVIGIGFGQLLALIPQVLHAGAQRRERAACTFLPTLRRFTEATFFRLFVLIIVVESRVDILVLIGRTR